MKNDKGVSIIEIMIAMTILAVVLIAMMSMFQVGITQTVLSGDITTATQLANEKIEEIRNLPFYVQYTGTKQDIDDFYSPAGFNNEDYDAEDSTTYVQEDDPNFPDYERHVTIQYVDSNIDAIVVGTFNPNDDEPPSNLLKVSVNVIWTTDTGARREHKEMTLIGR